MIGHRLVASGGSGSFTVNNPVILNEPDAGVWAAIQRFRAVEHGDYWYIGHINSDTGDVQVTVYNNVTRSFVATRTLNTAFAVDSHNNPALLVEANTGKLWTAYCDHDGAEMYLRISTSSLDSDPDLSDGFGAETGLHSQLGGFTDHTYPILVQLTSETNDPVYLFWREVGSGLHRLAMSKSTNGTTWSSRVLVYVEDAAASGTDPYWNIGSNNTSRFDVFVAENDELRHFYYDGAYRTSNGTDTGITPDANGGLEASDCTLVLDDTNGVVDRAFGVGWDGAPAALAWQKNGASTRRVVSVRWRSGAWQTDTVVDDVGGFLSGVEFQSGCDMDPTDPNLVFAARKINGVFEMCRYTTSDDGETWTEQQITSTSDIDQFNPCIVGSGAVWTFGTWVTEGDFSAGLRAYP